MLEGPLQTSRETQKSRRENGRYGRGTTRRENRGRVNGRAKGRNVTIKECARWVCDRLNEPKYYLMCRVVKVIGYNKTKRLLEQVQEIQVRWGKGRSAQRSERRSWVISRGAIQSPQIAFAGEPAETSCRSGNRCTSTSREATPSTFPTLHHDRPHNVASEEKI